MVASAAVGARTLLQRGLDAGLFGLLPVGCYLYLTAVWGGGYMVGTFKSEFFKLATLYPAKALSIIPLGLEDSLTHLMYSVFWRLGGALVRPIVAAPTWSGINATFIAVNSWMPAAVMVALLVWWLKSRRGTPLPDEVSGLWILILSVGICLVLLLAYLSVRKCPDELGNWSHLTEARFYRPFLPAAALLWLTMIESLGERSSTARVVTTSILAVCLVYPIRAEVRREAERHVRARRVEMYFPHDKYTAPALGLPPEASKGD